MVPRRRLRGGAIAWRPKQIDERPVDEGSVPVKSESQRVVWPLVGALLLALALWVFWPTSELARPAASPIADAPRDAEVGEASAKGIPSASTPAPADSPELSPSPASPAATPATDWIHERYAVAQKERAEIREGALRERRKLNVKERAAYWNVEARLVDEIGAEAYDQLLYDEGRNNRSRVHWVAPGSNAGQAGIESGDVILSYGGESVFAPRSVREVNRLFPSGEEIIVEVDRAGKILQFTMGTDLRNRGRSGIVNGMTLLPFSVRP